MSPTKEPSAIDDPQALADLEEVCRLLSEGKKVADPGVSRRITARANQARAEALGLFGVQEVAVEIVRAMRDTR
jgi:hypothetical protein